MPEKKVCTAQEIAEVLGLSVDTVWRYTREKRIPHLEVGPRQYRYVKEDVLDTLNGRKGNFQVQEEKVRYGASQKLTYEDYARLPDEAGYTLQLIDGLIIREPGPTVLHQRVSRRIQSILMAYFAAVDPRGEVFDAPLDLRLDEHTVVQPDLFYFPGGRPVSEAPIDVLPDLVVEIVSPSTATTDRIRKFHGYQKARVPHFWIVDPEDCLIQCYVLIDGDYDLVVSFNAGTFAHPSFPGLAFELDALFSDPV